MDRNACHRPPSRERLGGRYRMARLSWSVLVLVLVLVPV